MDINDNARAVLEKAAAAARRSGRKPEDVTVIGVTKTAGTDSITEMARAGITIAGENRVQELTAKREALAGTLPGLRWHMIGHLQTNKVKQAVASADMIHSVDSIRLAALIDRYASETGKVMDVLVEVNIGGEATKYGLPPGQVFGFMDEASKFNNISIRGLMCIAPFVENPEENRANFGKMFEMNKALKLQELSAGMTADYEVAIEEGATMVRVGTAIFGARV
jgi:pyridoxal phosphate enzyme (YggS family)